MNSFLLQGSWTNQSTVDSGDSQLSIFHLISKMILFPNRIVLPKYFGLRWVYHSLLCQTSKDGTLLMDSMLIDIKGLLDAYVKWTQSCYYRVGTWIARINITVGTGWLSLVFSRKRATDKVSGDWTVFFP